MTSKKKVSMAQIMRSAKIIKSEKEHNEKRWYYVKLLFLILVTIALTTVAVLMITGDIGPKPEKNNTTQTPKEKGLTDYQIFGWVILAFVGLVIVGLIVVFMLDALKLVVKLVIHVSLYVLLILLDVLLLWVMVDEENWAVVAICSLVLAVLLFLLYWTSVKVYRENMETSYINRFFNKLNELFRKRKNKNDDNEENDNNDGDEHGEGNARDGLEGGNGAW
jgi:amino acid permease